MSTEESATKVGDFVTAAMVECAPEAPNDAADENLKQDVSDAVDVSLKVQADACETNRPTDQAAEAMLTQNGADPPPEAG